MPPGNPATESREYEARHLLVLEGLEAVRKRPAMYIGSTDTRGLMHCLWEIIDNAVDEALGGYGKEIFGHAARRRRHLGGRPRPRHPGRHRAADRALRGRGGLHQAACRRQVRRRQLQRDRWPARCRLLGGERARQPARRRGGPRRLPPGPCRSAAVPRDLRRARAERAVHPRRQAARWSPYRPKRRPAPG